MRKSDIFLLLTACNVCLMLMMALHAHFAWEEAQSSFRQKETLVREIELTDLCLFTDARYTRHPAVSDLHTAFQDMPMAFEHFPSGSLMPPPPHLGRYAED